MPLLRDFADDALVVGDIIRICDNYDLGPGSGPVDLLIFDPADGDAGVGLMVVSGYKAGLVFAILPKESRSTEGLALSRMWLIENWDKWFVFTYQGDPIPIGDTRVLRWNERKIMEYDADSRST